jgi:serine/threonine protein kinase
VSGTEGAGGPSGRPGLDIGIPGIVETEEIGRGGFAVVYRGKRQGFDQSVAVKVLAAALDNESRQRFDREVRAMGALFGHPYIVGIITAGYTVADRPYIVMEDMTGGSLADAIRRRGPFTWQETVQIGDGQASALEAAHSAHVLHRDVKPENVLFSRYGAAKLSDFGLAAFTEGPETRSTTVMVSVAHTAPEVLDGAPRTASTDVYGLASTLMTMIIGRPPFARGANETSSAIFKRISTEPPPDLRPRGVPDAVCRVLERALAKTPEQRYATATEFRADLERARTSGTVAPVPVVAPAGSDLTETWVDPKLAAAPSPGIPHAAAPVPGPFTAPPPPPPPGTPASARRAGGFTGWIAANSVVAIIAAVVIVAGGGTGIYLASQHPSPSPTAGPTARPSQTPGQSTPTAAPSRSFDATAALLTSDELPSGSYTDEGAAPSITFWACAPADPTTGTATGSANVLYQTTFTDTQGNSVTVVIANYTYVFPSAADAAAFIQVAGTAARDCTAPGRTLPTPPQAGGSSVRLKYTNKANGDNDLIFVQAGNGASAMVVSSSADQWELFDSSIQTMAGDAAANLSSAQGS